MLMSLSLNAAKIYIKIYYGITKDKIIPSTPLISDASHFMSKKRTRKEKGMQIMRSCKFFSDTNSDFRSNKLIII